MDWATALVLDLGITVLAYLLVPVIFCISKKELTKRQIRKTVIINGIIVWLIFAIYKVSMDIKITSGAVVLWSSVAYGLLNKFCRKDIDESTSMEEEPINTPIKENFPDYLNDPNYKPIMPSFSETASETQSTLDNTNDNGGVPLCNLAIEQSSTHPSKTDKETHDTPTKKGPNKSTIIIIILSIIIVVLVFGMLYLFIEKNDNNPNKTNDSSVISTAIDSNILTFDKWSEKQREKSDFLDENIVFVIEGFENYYYTYDEMIYVTRKMDEYSFYAYNKEQAKALNLVKSNINVSNGWSSEKADFLDECIVFTIDGFGDYYYTYDEMISATQQMDEYSYWAYNIDQAISLGYTHR